MFRAELDKPQHRAGFFDFFDNDVLPLLQERRREQGEAASSVAHHVIAPELSPRDKMLFQQVKDGELAAPAVAGPGYRERIAAARSLGCVTTRLQIMQGSELNVPPDGASYLDWERDICARVHAESGEGVKAAWWSEQAEPMAAALAGSAGAALSQEFADGIRRNFPVGGHWAIYGDVAAEGLLVVAGVMYGKVGGEVEFEGFNVYTPDQLTPETRDYVRFWRDVHVSNGQSTTLLAMNPIP